MDKQPSSGRVALIEAGSPGLHIYSGVAMGRGVPLLATVARDAGYKVRAFVEDISGKDSVDWDWVATADVVGLSAITCTLPRTRRLLDEARRVNPKAVIVLGGPEPTCAPGRSFQAGADIVLRGEAEITFPLLLDALLGHGDTAMADIPGVMWREEGAVKEGPAPKQLDCDQLDALPLVDHALVHEADRAGVAAVWRARGCPQRCDFCEVCRIWPRYVRRSDGKSLEELSRAEEDGYGTAFLIDDNAAADKRSFMEFLRSIGERGFTRMLIAQLRADSVLTKDGRVDREFLRLLKRAAPVTVVCIGVESADEGALERIHKRVEVSGTTRALRALRRYGVLVHGMFIAFADDTVEALQRNGAYARRCVTSLQYLFETPLPGTKRTAEHEAAGSLLFEGGDDLAWYDGMHVVIQPAKMPVAEMQEQVLAAYRRFYAMPRVVASALRGTFGRFRRMSEGQRRRLAAMRPLRRLRTWLWLQAEYKYAPTAFLLTGRQRIRTFLADAEYEQYLAKIRAS